MKVGTGAASFFWNETADAIIAQRMNVAGIDFVSKDATLISGMWRLELCRAAYRRGSREGGWE